MSKVRLTCRNEQKDVEISHETVVVSPYQYMAHDRELLGSSGILSFVCPGCDQIESRDVDQRTVDLLLAAGATSMQTTVRELPDVNEWELL